MFYNISFKHKSIAFPAFICRIYPFYKSIIEFWNREFRKEIAIKKPKIFLPLLFSLLFLFKSPKKLKVFNNHKEWAWKDTK